MRPLQGDYREERWPTEKQADPKLLQGGFRIGGGLA